MIENIDTAAEEAQQEVERIASLIANSGDAEQRAVALQLKAQALDGIMVQGSGYPGDISAMVELGRKTKCGEDTLLLGDLLAAREQLARAVTFQRVFNLCLSGLWKSILRQKYVEKKRRKEIRWGKRYVTDYEITTACSKGIAALQERMAREGFSQ